MILKIFKINFVQSIKHFGDTYNSASTKRATSNRIIALNGAIFTRNKVGCVLICLRNTNLHISYLRHLFAELKVLTVTSHHFDLWAKHCERTSTLSRAFFSEKYAGRGARLSQPHLRVECNPLIFSC